MSDPVLDQRERIRRWVVLGKRLGYGLYLIAIVAFFVALITGPTSLLVWVVVGSIGVGSVFLVPAIIFGYGISAAEREERGASRH